MTSVSHFVDKVEFLIRSYISTIYIFKSSSENKSVSMILGVGLTFMLVRHVGGRICILGGFDELKYCRITLLQLTRISIGFNLPDVFVP